MHGTAEMEEMNDLDALDALDGGSDADGYGAGQATTTRRREKKPIKEPFLVYLGEETLPLVSAAMTKCAHMLPTPRQPVRQMGELLHEMITTA